MTTTATKENIDLYSLFLSKDVKSIEKALKLLENRHQLEKMLEALILITKKVKINYSLDDCMIPHIRKYFSTLPPTRAKSLADELITFCDNDHSPWAATALLRHLTESVQLGNAQRFRETVKTYFVQLHNILRNGKQPAVDDLIVALFRVLMFELNMQDDCKPEKLKEVWQNIKALESSQVYYLASFLLYSVLGEDQLALDAEVALCKFESLSNTKFIAFCEPYIHVPLVNFQSAGARIFLDRLIDYYISNDQIAHFCVLLSKVPEIRNIHLPSIEATLFSSILLAIFQQCLQVSTKRKTESDVHRLPQLQNLIELFYTSRRQNVDFDSSSELFQQIFSQCLASFKSFIFTKEMKASAFSYALGQLADIIPCMQLNTKLLLVSVMPFALNVPANEEKTIELQKVYGNVLKDIPSEYMEKLFGDHENMGIFLASFIKVNSKESSHIRQTCSQIVASFLHSDWTFLTGFVKNLQGKSADDLKSYHTLTPLFNKGIKNTNGIPRADTVICFQTMVNVYLIEAENMKTKQYRPKKGLSLIYDSLVSLLQHSNFLPENLSKQNSSFSSMTFDLVLNFIQIVRLCSLAEIEVDSQQTLIENLLDHYFMSDSFGQISDNEKEYVIERAVNVTSLGYAAGLHGYFANVKRLFSLMVADNGDELVMNVVRALTEEEVIKLKNQILKDYTVEKLSSDPETRNHVFSILTAIAKSRFPFALDGMDDYIYDVFTEIECLSAGAMNFATAYANVIRGSPNFADFVSVFIFTSSNILSSQKFYSVPSAVLTELKRAIAVTSFLKYVSELPPTKITILANQFPIIGRMVSKLISNLITYRHLITEITEMHRSTTRGCCVLPAYYDHFHKQLSNLTKNIASTKNSVINRQLPFVISNCLTGEREGNLPTYNLLSGCDESSISLLSTALPLIEKRRFAVTFPNFVDSNRFTG